jgi:hypothetical protein
MLAELQEEACEIITRQSQNDTQRQISLRSVQLWIATAGLVTIPGKAFHQYQQYETLWNNLATAACLSMATRKGTSEEGKSASSLLCLWSGQHPSAWLPPTCYALKRCDAAYFGACERKC